MKPKIENIVTEKQRMQAKIIGKFGWLELNVRGVELCNNCQHEPCLLLPITLGGEDCPYFERMAKDGEQTADSKND